MSLLRRLMAMVRSSSDQPEELEERALAATRRSRRARLLVAPQDSSSTGAPVQGGGRWLTIERDARPRAAVTPSSPVSTTPHVPLSTPGSSFASRPSPTDVPVTGSESSFSLSEFNDASSWADTVGEFSTVRFLESDNSTSTRRVDNTSSEGTLPQTSWVTEGDGIPDEPTASIPPAVFPDVPYPSLSRGGEPVSVSLSGGSSQSRGNRNMINYMVSEPTRRIAIHLSGGSATHIGVPHALPPGFPHAGNGNLTAFMGPRGSMGNLAGSLHGGVNVLLGGAMLSGLILLVFLICYCCQRSARKNDSHFRTQYWLPDPDGPLEVFTLDAQAQRLFLPPESVEALMQQASASAAPLPPPHASPPPAYHTLCHTVCLKDPAPSPSPSDTQPQLVDPCGADAKSAAAVAPVSVIGEELDADGLPSYEAALKLEAELQQRHM